MSAATVAAGVLGRHLGLRFDGSSQGRLERSLTRLAQQRALSPDALAASLQVDATALDALVDELTVQETSFFRHPNQFEALARHVIPGLKEPITIWSAGCANGQEPYSLAMLLAELGLERWQVVATDISRPALERTGRGLYSDRELRGLDATRRARHGRASDGGWQIRPGLLERVVTVRHRVAHDPLPVPAGSCQVVLCRNVLIYLEREDVLRFLQRAREALVPGGWLVLGGAEALVNRVEGLETAQVGDMFAYRKTGGRPTPVRDRVEAERALPSVRALLQTGELASARGDSALAVRAFRQAAYLEPQNPRAQLGLALTLEATGDAAAARCAFRAAWDALNATDAATLDDLLDGHDPGSLVSLIADRLKDAA